MSIDLSGYGFDYTRDLCRSIESYTSSAVKIDSRAYVYQGMQLRYAVERRLYIQCINSDALYKHYMVRCRGQISSDPLPKLTLLESDIARFLVEDQIDASALRRTWRYRLEGLARRAYGWLRRWPPGRLTARVPTQSAPEILIHVVNAKFANYMAPVTRLLDPNSFAYLVTTDPQLREQLRDAGHPVTGASSDDAALRHIFCSSYLADFVQLMRDADTILAAFRAHKPKCVVVVEGNAPTDVVTSEAARLLGIPCFCVQQGWSPYVHSGFRNMHFTEMFVWGRRFAEILKPHNPEQVFSITGSHTIKSSAVASQKVEVRVISFYLQSPCALISAHVYDEFLDLIFDVASAYPGVRIVVRAHPGYPLSVESRKRNGPYGNVHFSVPSLEPLADVIAGSDMVVSIFSTVILEAMAMNVVPLICSIGEMPKYEPPISAGGAAIEVFSINDARIEIDKTVANPARLNPIRASMLKVAGDYFSPQDASNIIARRLQDAAREAAD